MRWLQIFLLAVLIPSFAWAQEEEKQAEEAAPVIEADPGLYSPGYCEFEVTFPEAPFTTRRCDENDSNVCYDLVSYTQVYELSATVNFRVICNPAEDLYDQYKESVIRGTLKAMTARSVVKTFDMSYREEPAYKQAGLVGEGHVGVTPTIYIAQLWIGQHSIMSVEAELIGETFDAADQLFSDVLKSVQFVKDKKLTPPDQKQTLPEQPGNR